MNNFLLMNKDGMAIINNIQFFLNLFFFFDTSSYAIKQYNYIHNYILNSTSIENSRIYIYSRLTSCLNCNKNVQLNGNSRKHIHIHIHIEVQHKKFFLFFTSITGFLWDFYSKFYVYLLAIFHFFSNFQFSILLFELCHNMIFGASSSDEITTSIKSVSA